MLDVRRVESSTKGMKLTKFVRTVVLDRRRNGGFELCAGVGGDGGHQADTWRVDRWVGDVPVVECREDAALIRQLEFGQFKSSKITS